MQDRSKGQHGRLLEWVNVVSGPKGSRLWFRPLFPQAISVPAGKRRKLAIGGCLEPRNSRSACLAGAERVSGPAPRAVRSRTGAWAAPHAGSLALGSANDFE